MNQQEVKIKFTATGEGLDAVYKKIQEISKAPNIKLDDKLTAQIKSLEAKIPGLKQRIQTAMSQDSISVLDVASLDAEFKQVSRVVDKVIDDLAKKNLPAALQQQITKAKQEVEKARSELESIDKQIAAKSKNLDNTKKSGLSNQKAAKVAKEQGMGSFSLQTKNQGTLEFGSDVNGFLAKFDELRQKGELARGEVGRVVEITKQLNPAFKSAAQGIQTEIDALNAQRPAKQQAVLDSQNRIAQLQKEVSNNDLYSEQEKQTASDIVSASNKMQQAKRDEAAGVAAAKEQKKQETNTIDTNTKAQEKNTSTVAKAAKQVFTYGSVLNVFRRIYSTVTSTIKEMDKALTGMAVVTNMSREQTWQLAGEFENLAAKVGMTTTEIASMATKFYQQGKSTTQVIKLTEAAARAATVAGIDGSQSIDLLTNAMNGFQMSASKAMEVSDKFAALAASAATDYEELATALSKVAAQANLAGMSMDFTLGMLTKGIEVTREAPETIGTALKTVIARMRELTDYGATLEDGVDVNRVAKALANINVDLMDQEGQFRDLEQVLTEVGQKWNTLNKNQQANVAVALAGTRQQSRLIAMMQDFDRTLELVDISANSYGATLAQSGKYVEGLEAAQNRLTTAMQGLITNVTGSDTIIFIVEAITRLVDAVSWIVDQAWIMIPLLVIIGGHLLSAANAKLTELIYAREVRGVELEKLKAQKQQRKEQIKMRRTQLELVLGALREEGATEDTLENILKAAKVRAENAKNTALAQKYEAEIAKLNADDAKERMNVASVENEIAMLKAEEQLIDAQIAQTERQIVSQTGALPGIIGFITNGLTGVLSIITIIPSILTLIIGLRKKEGAEIDKNTAKEKKGFFASLKTAGAKMAQSAASIPVVGWVIAGAILAAIVGIAIAAATGAFKSNEEKTEDSISKTREELNKLQSDLYNMRTAQQNVAKLGDEFESLSGKIVKTEEDLERMKEIAQSVNDAAGRTVVDVNADAETQAKQIKAYNIQQEVQVDRQIEKMDDKLGQGMVDAVAAAWWGGTNARVNAKNEYLETLKTDDAFINSVRTVGQNRIAAIEGVSAATSDAVLDLLVENSASILTGKGLDISKFEKMIGESYAGGSFNDFVQDLEATAEDGSMTAYASMFDKIGYAADGTFSKLQKQLMDTNPMFAAVAKMGAETAKKFDSIGLSSDELNLVWKKVTQTAKILGKDAGEAFADLAKSLDASADIDQDGVISDLEYRQEMYRKLVEEQKKAADEANALMNGTSTNKEKQDEYNKAKKTVADNEELISDLQEQIDNLDPSDSKDAEKIKALQEQMDSLSAESAKAQEIIDNTTEAANGLDVSLEELKEILGIVTTQQITEEFTKLASVMERTAKITDLASMSLKDQMDLLSDYPELLSAMEKGYLTAADASKLYSKTIEQANKDIAANIKNYALIYSAEGGAKATAKDIGFEQLFKNDATGAEQRKKFLEEGIYTIESDLVKKLATTMVGDDRAFATVGELVQYLNGLKADVEAVNQQIFIQDQLEEGNYEILMSESAKEMWAAAKDLMEQRRASLNEMDELLERTHIDDKNYVDRLRKRNDLLLQTMQDGVKKLEELDKRKSDILTTKSSDENYKFLSQYADSNGSLAQYIYEKDGQTFVDYDKLSMVPEKDRETLLSYVATMVESLNTVAEERKEINEQIIEDNEKLAQSFIDSEARILEAQIAALEERKEAYEKYFEELDALAEEADRNTTLEDVTSQLAALAGGSGAATNEKRKELIQQLEDLKAEEAEARKQAIRDAVIEDIDFQINQLNEKLDIINDSLYKIMALMSDPSSIRTSVDNDGNVSLEFKDANGNFTPYKYAEGGLVDYTGPAWVDGTKAKPEAFLDAQDTKNIQTLLDALGSAIKHSYSAGNIENTNNSVVVEQINISTQQLNNDQDFRTAGQIFAEEFDKAIKKRGINVNVKK